MGAESLRDAPARADDFAVLGRHLNIIWTNNYQWLIMYRLLDVLSDLSLDDDTHFPEKRSKPNLDGIHKLFGKKGSTEKSALTVRRFNSEECLSLTTRPRTVHSRLVAAP